jgi:transcriptional regulator with XRE-family HTH domain
MAEQIRGCRTEEGLTLQQLATRSGVAASTIHKVEAGQMVPTVSILLKIARGLGRSPEELVRDQATLDAAPELAASELSEGPPPQADRDFAVWRVRLRPEREPPDLVLEPGQRVVLLVEEGAVRALSHGRVLDLEAGDCAEAAGSLGLRARGRPLVPARLTLIAAPPGRLAQHLGPPVSPRTALLRSDSAQRSEL